MKRICICGAGTMGSGIAQVSATAGFTTILFDVQEAVLQNAREKIDEGLEKLVKKAKLTREQKDEALGRLQYTHEISNCKADVIIEAIVEKTEAKISLFSQLATINDENSIFVSNTSSLSISRLADRVLKPQRFAGLHFFNPAPVMKLVEIVRGEKTDEAVVQELITLTREFSKTPVVCRDSPGFIVNRVARPFYIESLRVAEEEKVGYAVIDRLMEARGFKMGPFKLMDLIGNDINYAVSCSVYDQMQQPERLKPSYLQKEKVEKGELGKKTSKGYYNYNIQASS